MEIDIQPGLNAIDSLGAGIDTSSGFYSGGTSTDRVLIVKAKAIIRNYFKAHGEAFNKLIPVSSGEFYELEVLNPDSGRKRKAEYLHTGKIDGIVAGTFGDRTGRFLIERKITDQDIRSDSQFWNRIRIDSQLDEYALAYWQQNGQMIDGIIFDAIKQPGIRPKTITQAEIHLIATEGTYCGEKVDRDMITYCHEWTKERAEFDSRKKEHAKRKKSDPTVGDFEEEAPPQPEETPELFGIRFAKHLEQNLSECFAFQFVPISREKVLNWARELWTLSGIARESDRFAFSPRNCQSCFNFSQSCEYVPLCSGVENPVDEETGEIQELSNRWQIVKPSEQQKKRLSMSRLKVLQDCPRKHWFRHVAGIVPVNEPTSERLLLIRLVQKGIETVWQRQQQISENQSGQR